MTPLEKMLVRHEGLKLRIYNDTMGIPTIGIGRNLRDVGIDEDEAFFMLANDIDRAQKYAAETFAWFARLNEARQDVIVDMIFNIGPAKIRGFTKMLAAIEASDFDLAAAEMLDSQWCKQVGARAVELSQMMKTGAYVPVLN